ncbi:MAG TPA: hypothetical protein VK726_14465 [Acetobacteraceae bacterium]|nr:hypothetical protein [Acetobacteraceae bacterium]
MMLRPVIRIRIKLPGHIMLQWPFKGIRGKSPTVQERYRLGAEQRVIMEKHHPVVLALRQRGGP